MKNRISKTFLVLLFLIGSSVSGQRNNAVLHNSPSSYGFSISSGLNTFGAKTITEAKQVGVKNTFGVSYLLNRHPIGIESGLTFGHQRLRFNEEIPGDTASNKYALKLVSLGLPVRISYKFSQNRRRSYVFLGVNPELIIKSSVVANKSELSDPINNSICSLSKKGNLMFGGQLGFGRSYDLDQHAMVRVELTYGFSALSLLEDRFSINTFGLRLQFMNHN